MVAAEALGLEFTLLSLRAEEGALGPPVTGEAAWARAAYRGDKQAFGRLIRGASDKGCFVILEGATPSRLLRALPEQAPVLRCGLAEAVQQIRKFLAPAA